MKILLILPLLFLATGCFETSQDHKEATDRMVELTNQYREEADLNPLKTNPALMRVAQKTAELMGEDGKISHKAGGKTLPERVAEIDYKWFMLGENVASGYPDADQAVVALMLSAAHRDNILLPGFTEIGVGYVVVDDIPYYCQIFAIPR